MISSNPESTLTSPPPLPQAEQSVPGAQGSAQAKFKSGMSGAEMLGLIFQTCDEMGVSDVQLRSGLPVYIETNHGMECLHQLGALSSEEVYEIYQELIRNRESASHGFGEDGSAEVRAESCDDVWPHGG